MKKVHLTPEQRYTISVMHKQGYTQKVIAETIGKDKSVISRELKRNRDEKGRYSFYVAQQLADIRKERTKRPRKLTAALEKQIVEHLKGGWSPEQISGRMKLNNQETVSHETIYKLIRKDKEDGGNLYQFTRHKLKHRKRPVGKYIPIKNRVSIDERPLIVDLKERFGDWEMDTIIGKNGKGAMVTLVERTTAFCMVAKLDKGKNAKELTNTVFNMLIPYKKWIKTITVDNGTEFSDHQRMAKLLDTKVFFTHPYSSWQKGLIENTNKLIRQYIPKKSNFNEFKSQDINRIQRTINSRPRKNLNFYSPKEIFFLNLNT